MHNVNPPDFVPPTPCKTELPCGKGGASTTCQQLPCCRDFVLCKFILCNPILEHSVDHCAQSSEASRNDTEAEKLPSRRPQHTCKHGSLWPVKVLQSFASTRIASTINLAEGGACRGCTTKSRYCRQCHCTSLLCPNPQQSSCPCLLSPYHKAGFPRNTQP